MPELSGKPFAFGRTAEIYAWEDGRILKLFYDWVSEPGVRREAANTHTVHSAGLPVPEAYDVLRFGDRLGIVFDRIEGPTGLGIFKDRPWEIVNIANVMATLHAKMHAIEIPVESDLPTLHRKLAQRIQEVPELNDRQKSGLLERLAALPDGSSILHGDFHPDNIMFTPGGPVIIDWIDASVGNPLADVARTKLLLMNGSPLPKMPNRWVLSTGRVVAYTLYECRYARLRPFDRREIDAWAPVLAGARLWERIPSETEWLVSVVDNALKS
jgi:aminoglycoside phosphotransferase (APT) family kinase protein